MKLAVLPALFAAAACFAQPGALDLSFNPGSGPGGGLILGMSLTKNGQILVVGSFTTFNGVPSQYVARLNADGSLDGTFNVGIGPSQPVSIIVSQTNGDTLIAGNFLAFNGLQHQYLVRLGTNGHLDNSFTSMPNNNVDALVNLNNGAFMAAGTFTSINATPMRNIALFDADGSLDMTFQPASILGGNGVQALAVQTNGFIVIGGYFTSVGGQSYQFLARLNPSGAVDTTFVGPGIFGGPSYAAVTGISIQSNAQIMIQGTFTSINGYSELGVARLNSDGTLDTTFRDSAVNAWDNTLGIQSDGKVVIMYSPSEELAGTGVARLNLDGSLDTSFTVTTDDAYLNALVIQTDGKILVAGPIVAVDGTNINGIARLLGDSASQAGVQLLNMNLYPGMFLSGSV